MADDDLGDVRTQSPVPTLSRTGGRVEHAGPAHDERNEVVYLDEIGLDEIGLDEIGLDEADYEALRSGGAI